MEDTLTSLGNTATDLRSRMYTQEGYTSDLRTRMSTAEGNITSHGTRLTTAESDIDALDNSKVDKTTPLLNFDDTATDPLTDDGALANALRALGILNDVIQSGGGTLYLKKLLTELANEHNEVPITITPTTGITISVNNSFAVGSKWVYLWVKGRATTKISNSTIFTFPSEYSAKSSTLPIFKGTEWDINSVGYGYVGNNAVVSNLTEGDWFHINILLPRR